MGSGQGTVQEKRAGSIAWIGTFTSSHVPRKNPMKLHSTLLANGRDDGSNGRGAKPSPVEWDANRANI